MDSPVPAAWESSVAKFLSSLPDAQRKAVEVPASPEQCLVLVQQIQAPKKGYDRLVVVLEPLISPLKRFESSLDVLSQSHALGSPIWGVLRIIVTMTSERLDTLQTLTKLLEQIVDPLKRFRDYEKLFRENVLLQNAIGMLYCDLLDFCTRVVRHYSRRSFRSAFGSFDKDFREVSENVRHHWREIDAVANAADIREAKEFRIVEQARRQVEDRAKINRWLNPANTHDDQQSHLVELMPDSCNWVISEPMLRALLSSPDSSTIIIQGLPGSGKTMVMSFLVGYLSTILDSKVLFFFCKANEPEKRDALQVLRTLAWELLQFFPNFYNSLEPWYAKSGRIVLDSYSELQQIFTSLLSLLQHKPIYIVIDALDECANAQVVFSCIQASLAVVKCIISTRSGSDIDIWKKGSFLGAIQMQKEAVVKSVNQFVSRHLSEFQSRQRIELPDHLVRRLTIETGGLWLYARLLMDEISHAASFTEIESLLDSIPQGIEALYTTILSARGERISKPQLRMAKELFLWLDTTDYVSESSQRFRRSIYLCDNTFAVLLMYANRGEQVFNPIKVVRDLCFPLVEVRKTPQLAPLAINDSNNQETTFAKFTHLTARQYLQWVTDTSPQGVPALLKPRRLQTLYRGTTATWYFAESALLRAKLDQLQDRPQSFELEVYLEMVGALWDCLKLESLRKDLNQDESRKANEMMENLIAFVSTEKCLRWIEASIVVDFAWKSRRLTENLIEAFSVVQNRVPERPALGDYRTARLKLFRDFACALSHARPVSKETLEATFGPFPSFDVWKPSKVGASISELAQKYRHLVADEVNLGGLQNWRTLVGEQEGADAVRSQFLTALESAESLREIHDCIQSTLKTVISQELGILDDEMNPANPLLDYGVDSLLAVSISVRIQRIFDVEIGPYRLVHFTTETLQEYIQRESPLIPVH